MEAKNTLFHINWGDGDNTYVVAPDKETALARMPDGKDMINYVVRLDGLYQLILKAGIGEVVEFFKSREVSTDLLGAVRFFASRAEWQAKLKEWGIAIPK